MMNKNVTPLMLTAYEKVGSVGISELEELIIDEIVIPTIKEAPGSYLYLYNDFLSENNCYDDGIFFMEEFEDIVNHMERWEVVRSCFFGGLKPLDPYFYFNGYGNLASCDDWELAQMMLCRTDFLHHVLDEEFPYDEDEATDIIRQANELIKQGF